MPNDSKRDVLLNVARKLKTSCVKQLADGEPDLDGVLARIIDLCGRLFMNPNNQETRMAIRTLSLALTWDRAEEGTRRC